MLGGEAELRQQGAGLGGQQVGGLYETVQECRLAQIARATLLELANEAVSRENLRRAAELERMAARLARARADLPEVEGGIVGKAPALFGEGKGAGFLSNIATIRKNAFPNIRVR